mgnify:CR=1 FL=1
MGTTPEQQPKRRPVSESDFAPLPSPACREWARLMKSEVSLRRRIHAAQRQIICELETAEERADMRDRLAEADRLLTELKNLLGEAGGE